MKTDYLTIPDEFIHQPGDSFFLPRLRHYAVTPDASFQQSTCP